MRSVENRAEKRDPEATNQWHVLYTRHQHEKSVAQQLSNRGHEVFLPLVGATHRWQDRTKRLWLPLFPCYVFIRGGFDRHLQILSIPGMINVVTCGGRAAIIPRLEIDAVRQMIESALRVESHPFLQCWRPCEGYSRAAAGIEGILIRMKNMSRLVVSVEMLASSAAVEIDITCVEASSLSQIPLPMRSQPFSASCT